MSAHKNSKTPSLIPLFSQHKTWEEVKRIIQALNNSGATTYLAGGCVRDALLNQIPKDFDIATSARPEEIIRLFPNSNKQGKAFGVVAVFHSRGQPIEVATFRKDGPYTDGRHPEYVEFLSDKEDALRRDFTVNALFYDLRTDKIIDYIGGIEDLQKKVIRTVGEPNKRFQEDHLRILRAIRFSIQLNFEIENSTKEILFKMKDKLFTISRERIYEEGLKIIKTGYFVKALTAFKELSLLQKLCPFLEKVNWPFCLNFWQSSESTISSQLLTSKNFLWSQAFYPILIQQEKEVLNTNGKWNTIFSHNLKKWKFPISILRAMNDIFYFSCCLLNIRPASFGKKMRILNSDFSESILFLSKNYLKNKNLDTDIIDKIKKDFLIRAPEGKLPEPLINGNDLKALGISEDKGMASMLEYLYDLQLEQQIQEKTKLLKIARSLDSQNKQ